MHEKKNISIFATLMITSVIIIVSSMFMGRYTIEFSEFISVAKAMWHGAGDDPVATVLFDIRLPRILAAFLVGGTLSITGAAYQGMFRNPMVSPSILGVSAGAGFGAALSILLGFSRVMLQLTSFTFGIVAIVTVYLISLSTGKKQDRCLTLILSGMIVGTLFSAFISILKYMADPDGILPSIVYWLMGGLSSVESSDLLFISIIAAIGLLFLSLSGRKLDMLAFGDDEAKTMGIDVDRFRYIVIIIATLLTASAVSISGIIGWVGLLIPHVSRMLVGAKNAVLLPSSFLIGGSFLLLVDDFSRTISTIELPLGITTSLIGAPFFIFILMKTSKK